MVIASTYLRTYYVQCCQQTNPTSLSAHTPLPSSPPRPLSHQLRTSGVHTTIGHRPTGDWSVPLVNSASQCEATTGWRASFHCLPVVGGTHMPHHSCMGGAQSCACTPTHNMHTHTSVLPRKLFRKGTLHCSSGHT